MRSPLRHVPVVEARAAITSLVIGAVLLGVKFIAYFLTGSSVVFADAMESIVNVLAAAFAIYALAYAHQPADQEHPYGHGKIEFLFSAFEGVMIVGTAVVMVVAALRALALHVEPGRIEAGLILVGAAMAVHTVLGLYLLRVGRRKSSMTLESDGKHLLVDALTSAAALITLLAVHWTGWPWVDPAGAMVVAFFVAITGVGLLRRSAAGLMDEQVMADTALLRKILDGHLRGGGQPPEAQICGYHKLRHRHSGRYHWVDFHITVPPVWNIARAHELASAIEYEIEQALGEGDATAHVEPCADPSCACRGDPVAARPREEAPARPAGI